MKKVSLIFLIVAAPLFLRAQDSTTTGSNFPYWTISKDVQRLTYQKTVHAPLTIEVTDISTLVSKNVHRKKTSDTRHATLSGYPTWTISKPVARQTVEGNAKKRAAKD